MDKLNAWRVPFGARLRCWCALFCGCATSGVIIVYCRSKIVAVVHATLAFPVTRFLQLDFVLYKFGSKLAGSTGSRNRVTKILEQ
jgi:hypothetical protein